MDAPAAVAGDVPGHGSRGPADEDLIERARAGDGSALAELWSRWAPAVASFARARGAADVDEITNDAFLAAFRALPGFGGDLAAFRALLFTIARRRVVDEMRHRGRRVRTVAWSPTHDERTADSPEDQVLAQADLHDLHERLSRLTPDQRDVVLLRLLADLTLEEVAHALGKRVGTVKSLQRRAVDTLRRTWHDTGPPDDLRVRPHPWRCHPQQRPPRPARNRHHDPHQRPAGHRRAERAARRTDHLMASARREPADTTRHAAGIPSPRSLGRPAARLRHRRHPTRGRAGPTPTARRAGSSGSGNRHQADDRSRRRGRRGRRHTPTGSRGTDRGTVPPRAPDPGDTAGSPRPRSPSEQPTFAPGRSAGGADLQRPDRPSDPRRAARTTRAATPGPTRPETTAPSPHPTPAPAHPATPHPAAGTDDTDDEGAGPQGSGHHTSSGQGHHHDDSDESEHGSTHGGGGDNGGGSGEQDDDEADDSTPSESTGGSNDGSNDDSGDDSGDSDDSGSGSGGGDDNGGADPRDA